MKIIFTLLTVFFISTVSNSAEITLVVKNLDKSEGGYAAFGVYKSHNWLDEKNYNYSVREKVTGNTMTLKIKNVPAGKYGIAGYQDTNGNHKVDKNLVGFPKEPIGFSNGATIGFGPPSFEDAMIEVKEGASNTFIIELD
ncbi:MAG: DUF2141 domain-containing protein [Candidatus Kapaibacteriales bacterium]